MNRGMYFFFGLPLYKELPALMDASLFTLEKRLIGRKPSVFTGFGGCLLELVSVCAVPGLWKALNEH